MRRLIDGELETLREQETDARPTCGRCHDTGYELVADSVDAAGRVDDAHREPCQCPAGQAVCEAEVAAAHADPDDEIPF